MIQAKKKKRKEKRKYNGKRKEKKKQCTDREHAQRATSTSTRRFTLTLTLTLQCKSTVTSSPLLAPCFCRCSFFGSSATRAFQPPRLNTTQMVWKCTGLADCRASLAWPGLLLVDWFWFSFWRWCPRPATDLTGHNMHRRRRSIVQPSTASPRVSERERRKKRNPVSSVDAPLLCFGRLSPSSTHLTNRIIISRPKLQQPSLSPATVTYSPLLLAHLHAQPSRIAQPSPSNLNLFSLPLPFRICQAEAGSPLPIQTGPTNTNLAVRVPGSLRDQLGLATVGSPVVPESTGPTPPGPLTFESSPFS